MPEFRTAAVPVVGDLRRGSAALGGPAQVDARVGGAHVLQGPQQVILRSRPLP